MTSDLQRESEALTGNVSILKQAPICTSRACTTLQDRQRGTCKAAGFENCRNPAGQIPLPDQDACPSQARHVPIHPKDPGTAAR